MSSDRPRRVAVVFLNDYGMLVVLAVLCVFFSVMTRAEQFPTGTTAARQLAALIAAAPELGPVVIVVRRDEEDAAFANALRAQLKERVVATVAGDPRAARAALGTRAERGERIGVLVCNSVTASWSIYDPLRAKYPALKDARVLKPEPYRWPNFLKTENLFNIANQIAVIAIIAVGMTLVIITGGVDLSVGSLIALSAVLTARLIRDAAGGEAAGMLGMSLACGAGVVACGGSGAFSGAMVTLCRIPPFIATLGVMLVASGAAYILANGQSINQVPEAFVRLGRGADLAGVPNAVVLMLALYIIAHVVMTRTIFGRYVYAVGGNATAARLSGVPVTRVIILVYVLSGALAGLGGVLMASQLRSGAPTYGQMYELYVIAAVVVGGASLSGGQGKVFGTLIGAFIIAVIQNGMNLMGVESYTQKIVLGLVILAAVLADRLKHGLIH
jgi:ribose transport system permease protein